MSQIRVTTPSRLHFGLLGWGDQSPRQFGGVGLMIEDPGLEIVVETARCWESEGPLSERAIEVGKSVEKRLAQAGHPIGPVRIQCVRAPEAHVGLGVGTQLSLAVARGMSILAGVSDASAETLARLTGRGLRSGIGIHGFDEGGLIVDAGRRNQEDIPTRLIRLKFPENWDIVVVTPKRKPGLHGPEELSAFETLPRMEARLTERICHQILLGLLPAIVEEDIKAFGESLEEIQRIVGAAFSPVQGGRFARAESESVAEKLIGMGFHGVGQSSWGPSLYGFTVAQNTEKALLKDRIKRELGNERASIIWTRAANSGARSEIG